MGLLVALHPSDRRGEGSSADASADATPAVTANDGRPAGLRRTWRKQEPGGSRQRRAAGKGFSTPLPLGRHDEGQKEEQDEAGSGTLRRAAPWVIRNGFTPPGSGGAPPPTLPPFCYIAFPCSSTI
jgi:hypothetical protein